MIARINHHLEISSEKVGNILEELVISNCKHLKSSFFGQNELSSGANIFTNSLENDTTAEKVNGETT